MAPDVRERISNFTFMGRIKSVKNALKGIFTMLKSQHNAWIHALATITVFALGFYFGLNKSEWCWIVLVVISVWTAEAINTSFEFLADAASPGYHPLIKKAKDVAAGAVLISSIGSVIIGLLIIGPYIKITIADTIRKSASENKPVSEKKPKPAFSPEVTLWTDSNAEIASWHKDALICDCSPVDFSFLNHKPAGKHGFVTTKGDQLVFEDGTSARFWGGNLAAEALFCPKEKILDQARRIAQLGYNLMRIHHHDSISWVNPTVIDKNKNDTRHLDAGGMDCIDYWIKCLRDNGVYVWLDLHVGRRLKEGDEMTENGLVSTFNEIMRRDGKIKGFCFYDRAVQGLMKEFQKKYLNHMNPYTNLAYKNDPVIIGLLISNENDIINHFGNLALPDKNNPELNRLFTKSLKNFCSKTGLSRHKAWQTWMPGESKIFLNNQEHLFNITMIDDLKEIGVHIPICTTSTWGGNGLFCLPALTAGNIIDVHIYEESEFLSRNPHYESNMASWIGAGQVYNYPISITEWNMVSDNNPVVDRFTAPLYLASIGCLQGWDAQMVYNYSQRSFEKPPRQYPWSTFSDPGITAIMPAAAICFRQSHITRARKTYCLKLNRQQLYYDGLMPDKCCAIRTLVETSKFTIGLPDIPELDWDSETIPSEEVITVTDPHRDFIPNGQNYVKSDTDELCRYWTRGIQTIDSSCTQAAQGRIGGEEILLSDVRIKINTPKAVVAVTALDKRPIRYSDRLLITTVARVIAPEGKMPFYSEPVTGELSIYAEEGLTLVPLQADGSEGKTIKTLYSDQRYLITLDGQSGTHWYLLYDRLSVQERSI